MHSAELHESIATDRTATASAHGRVNLIGEHTDYHEGYVLPALIPQATSVQVQRRDDQHVRASSNLQGGSWQEYDLGDEMAGRGWLDYIQGTTSVLTADGLTVPGFDVTVQSDVPVGAGLSSSAALIVSLLRALRTLVSLPLDDVQLARLAQRVEVTFVGAPVGIMDTMASSVGREREGLLLDTRSLACERIPLPGSFDLLVIDSGVRHSNSDGGYALRRQESMVAATWLGVRVLRDLDEQALAQANTVPSVLARRAKHVVTENGRVLRAADALRNGDGPALGALLCESHESMRADYEISTSEIDVLVSLGQAHPEIFGARMTGGGFGGSVVMIAKPGQGQAAALHIMAKYAAVTSRRPRLIT
ncbi:MAG TPA: galactokinase [Vicinamibacterales bacterium]|nr:galactokinase [Vicinamibacterales bacterium]